MSIPPMPIKIVTPDLSFVGLRLKKRPIPAKATVHCTATPPEMDIGAVEVDRMHRKRNFLCIGYNFIIRRNGVIESGRPLDTHGSHCKDGNRNETHIGIALVGGISSKPQKHVPGNKWNGSDAEANFTPAQMASLSALLAHLGISPSNTEGHRDVPRVTKACPSFEVKHWLRTGEVKL